MHLLEIFLIKCKLETFNWDWNLRQMNGEVSSSPQPKINLKLENENGAKNAQKPFKIGPRILHVNERLYQLAMKFFVELSIKYEWEVLPRPPYFDRKKNWPQNDPRTRNNNRLLYVIVISIRYLHLMFCSPKTTTSLTLSHRKTHILWRRITWHWLHGTTRITIQHWLIRHKSFRRRTIWR